MICFGSFRQTLIWRTGSKVVLKEDNHNEWFVVPPAIHNWNVAGSVYSFKDITFIFTQFREFNLYTTAKIHTLFSRVKTIYIELHLSRVCMIAVNVYYVKYFKDPPNLQIRTGLLEPLRTRSTPGCVDEGYIFLWYSINGCTFPYKAVCSLGWHHSNKSYDSLSCCIRCRPPTCCWDKLNPVCPSSPPVSAWVCSHSKPFPLVPGKLNPADVVVATDRPF